MDQQESKRANCPHAPACGCEDTCGMRQCAHCGAPCTGTEELPPRELYAAHVRFCEACLPAAKMRAAAVTKGFRVGL